MFDSIDDATSGQLPYHRRKIMAATEIWDFNEVKWMLAGDTDPNIEKDMKDLVAGVAELDKFEVWCLTVLACMKGSSWKKDKLFQHFTALKKDTEAI